MLFKVKIGEITEELQAELLTTIEVLKIAIEDRTGVKASSQKWIYQGRILANDFTVEKAGIVEGNVVHVVKTAQQSTTASQNDQSSGSIQLPPPPQYQLYISNFDIAMKKILLNPQADAKNGVITLSKVIKNIIDHPLDEKYRTLKGSNATLQKKLLALSGGPECLRVLGFSFDGTDWTLAPSPQAWEVLLLCRDKIEKFVLLLQSLDPEDKSSASSPAKPAIPAPGSVSAPSASDHATSAALQEVLCAFVAMQTSSTQNTAQTADLEPSPSPSDSSAPPPAPSSTSPSSPSPSPSSNVTR